MLFWILSFIGVFLFVLPLIILWTTPHVDAAGTLFVLSFVFLALPMVSYTNHVSDLGRVEYGEQYIKVSEKRLEELRTALPITKDLPVALVNVDTPVATTVHQINNILLDIENERKGMVRAERNIYERKMGLMSGVMVFFDEEDK